MPAAPCGPLCASQQPLTGNPATLALTPISEAGIKPTAQANSGAVAVGAKPPVVVNISLAVPYYSQLDARWPTLGASGCLITCMAMILAYYGCKDDDGNLINPGTLKAYLVKKNAIDAGGNLSGSVEFTFGDQTFKRNQASSLPKTMGATLLQELVDKRPVIAKVTKPTMPSHFVVVVGSLSDGNHLMNDPGRRALVSKKGAVTYRGDGADPTHLVPTSDTILEAPRAKGTDGQGYQLVRVDTVTTP